MSPLKEENALREAIVVHSSQNFFPSFIINFTSIF
jgi:hypothetical protein